MFLPANLGKHEVMEEGGHMDGEQSSEWRKSGRPALPTNGERWNHLCGLVIEWLIYNKI